MATRWLHWIILCTLTVCMVAGGLPELRSFAEDRPAGEPGVLLLEGNRIMRGRITPGTVTYSVAQDSSGVVIVPRDQVRYQGPDLHSIYVFLLDGLPKDASATDHVRLARWCIQNKLMPEARFELETALDMDPSRDDIRRNLSVLDSHINRPPPTSKPVKPQSPAERMAGMSGLAGETVESLGGLPREAGQQFTTKIQPILMRNCTNAACHGPSADNALKFSIAIGGGNTNRATSEKNLLALMKYVDREHPRSSPLWKILVTNHGARGSSIFTGLKGSAQLQSCKDWVLSLATSVEDLEDEPSPDRKVRNVTQVSGIKPTRKPQGKVTRPPELEEDEEPLKSSSVRMKSAEAETSKTQTRNATTQSRKSKSSIDEPDPSLPDVEPIVSKSREPVPDLPPVDPFDPEVFNRRQRIKRETYE